MKLFFTKVSNKAVELETNIDFSWWSDITTKIDPLQIFLTNYGDWLINFFTNFQFLFS